MAESGEGKRTRIAIDAMGGDYAPGEVVRGAVDAARELEVDVLLVGVKGDIERELGGLDVSGLPVSVVEATDLIRDGEEPAFAVLRKPNSPVAVAARLVKEGEADAMVSAGSTGACMVAALRYLGTLPGIDRPMAGGAFLGLAPNTVVLDLGANVGCQPYHMVNFAAAGTVFARVFLGIESPTVGLLNVGVEEGKGNEQAKEAYSLLKNSGLNFIGNVEGMDIPAGKANVVVCDGYVGNIVVKFCEGMARTLAGWLGDELKDAVPKEQVDAVTGKLVRLMSPGTVMGGGPLWGVNGVACVAHGASRAPQIVGTVGQAKRALESGFVDRLRSELERAQASMSSQQ
ncbi:MAG: phosphate acyltransferase PlsX [Chloroflexota bacterium]|nr:phosphate acyltransferase PlsX [Chloroflexota bacterium]